MTLNIPIGELRCTEVSRCLSLRVSNTHGYFGIFASLAWGVWGYKLLLSLRYRPVEGNFVGTFSIVIPTYREDTNRLRDTIKQALEQQPLEVIVAVDQREPRVRQYLVRYFGDAIRTTMIGIGKRNAMVSGIRIARGEFIMAVDSDVLLEHDAARKLLVAFNDPEVGGVCGYTRLC